MSAQLVEDRPTGVWKKVGRTVTGMTRRVRRALAEARARAALRGELSRLEAAGELDHVLGDLGVSRAELPALAQNHPGSARRLAGMLHRLGIRVLPEAATGSEMRAIKRTCLLCGATGQCERWLRSTRPTSLARNFCPNSPAFDALVIAGKATRTPQA
ncbi:MAG TPA: DUF6455 family protein [Stellaceae bacterium]|nr:DUF6455 family protein [Stellaceae bacterium]